MNPMECSPTILSPPTKKIKLENSSTPQAAQKKITSSPKPNIVQRIKYVLADQRTPTHARFQRKYRQTTENTTVFNFEDSEILVVNAPYMICNWSPTPIPYICIPVQDNKQQRTAINRTVIMLSALYQLPNCPVGIKIDPENCQESDSQIHDLTKLRRTIWLFLAENATFMPPYLRQFLKAELKNAMVISQSQSDLKLTSEPKFKKPFLNTKEVIIFYI